MKIKPLKVVAGFAVLISVLYGLHAASLNSEMESRLSNVVWQNSIREAERAFADVGPSTLEKFLEVGEAELENRLSSGGTKIRTGHRKRIRWIDSEKNRGKREAPSRRPWSIVYFHGFSAGPLELEPTISKLAEKLNANLYLTRLSAHGLTDGESFATVDAKDWVRDVAEAMQVGRILGDHTLVIGTSTGAALALRYASAALDDESVNNADPAHANASPEKSHLRAMILLSPNYKVSAFGAEVLGNYLGPRIAQVLVGKYREFSPENALHGSRWTTKYRSEALHELILVTNSARRVELGKLKVPVLTIYTSKDDVVSVSEIEKRSADFLDPHSLTINWLEGERHELASETFQSEKVDGLVNLMSDWFAKLKIGAREN